MRLDSSALVSSCEREALLSSCYGPCLRILHVKYVQSSAGGSKCINLTINNNRVWRSATTYSASIMTALACGLLYAFASARLSQNRRRSLTRYPFPPICADGNMIHSSFWFLILIVNIKAEPPAAANASREITTFDVVWFGTSYKNGQHSHQAILWYWQWLLIITFKHLTALLHKFLKVDHKRLSAIPNINSETGGNSERYC